MGSSCGRAVIADAPDTIQDPIAASSRYSISTATMLRSPPPLPDDDHKPTTLPKLTRLHHRTTATAAVSSSPPSEPQSSVVSPRPSEYTTPSVEVGGGGPVSLLVWKMEKGLGLTSVELDHVERIVKAAPAYINSAHRAKLIGLNLVPISTTSGATTPPTTTPLLYPSSPLTCRSEKSPRSDVCLLNTIEEYDAGDVGGVGSGAAFTVSGSSSRQYARIFDGTPLQAVTEASGSSGGHQLIDTHHGSDPKLIQMIEDSRKKCYQSWLVIRCWKSVLDREDTGLETSFVELLHRSGSHVLGVERSDLFVNFIDRGKPILDMITKLIELGLDNAESVYTLHELGARHVAYGLTRQDYESYTGPFVRTVEMCARPSTMNTQVRTILRGFFQRATSMMLEGAVESRSSSSLKFAPKGAPFAIVFTDIEGSTALWESQPVAMEKAVDEHHKLMRDLIHDHNGYEVKTIGDSFMVAFKSLAEAVTMALRVQVELFRASSEGLVVDGTNCEASGAINMWNPSSLRVRVGVHWCTDALPKFDVVYKRYDYYGNDVNAASRVQDAACGGQILISESTLSELNGLEAELNLPTDACGQIVVVDSHQLVGDNRTKASLKDVLGTSLYMENAELKGLQDSVTLHSLYPQILEGRVYGKRKKDVFVE